MDRPDRERAIREILGQEVTIDELVITDRVNEWNCHTGGIHEYDVDKLAAKIIALFPDEEVRACGLCGGKMSNNPHPDAGKPNDFLTVGTQYVCIPCECKNRHEWANRALEAEGQIEELKQNYEYLIKVKVRQAIRQTTKMFVSDIKEAKREERERVLDKIKEKFMLRHNSFINDLISKGSVVIYPKAWQALKEEK